MENMRWRLPFARAKPRRPKATFIGTYGLTPLGKVIAETYQKEGVKGEVLEVLRANGPGTIQKVANESQMSPEKAKRVISALMASGWVKREQSEV